MTVTGHWTQSLVHHKYPWDNTKHLLRASPQAQLPAGFSSAHGSIYSLGSAIAQLKLRPHGGKAQLLMASWAPQKFNYLDMYSGITHIFYLEVVWQSEKKIGEGGGCLLFYNPFFPTENKEVISSKVCPPPASTGNENSFISMLIEGMVVIWEWNSASLLHCRLFSNRSDTAFTSDMHH